MTKEYKFQLDNIDIRSIGEGKEKEYVVKAYAMIPNAVDLYKFQKTPHGYKSFKSLFTDNCVQSFNRQAQSKKIFVDMEHEIASKLNIRGIIDKINKESEQKYSNDLDKINSYIKISDIPFAKPSKIEIDDKGMVVEAKVNPHSDNFEQCWKSIEKGFINGMSINFKPTKISEKFIEGEWVDVIEDGDLYGFSFTGGAALPENSIFEVAVRSVIEMKEEKVSTRSVTEEKMAEDIKGALNDKDAKIKELETQIAKTKEEQTQGKIEEEKKEFKEHIEALENKLKEQSEKSEKEIEDTRKILKDLQNKEETHSKGVVSPQDKYAQKISVLSKEEQAKLFNERLDKASLGELLALESEYNTYTLRNPETMGLARQKSSEDMTPK